MEISLTKVQVQELLQLVHIGRCVRNGIFDEVEDMCNEALEDALYHAALLQGISGVEEYECGFVGLSQELDDECHEILEAFKEELFWSELELRLGQRDMDKGMSASDWLEVEEDEEWLPERLLALFDLYAREFEEFGIDRLEINVKASVLARDWY